MTERTRESTIDWEKDIYAQGKQLNRWPFSEVVSAVIRATSEKKREEVSILELGCGTGNNVWFLAEEGFRGHGIDLSSSAIQYAKRHLAMRGIDAELRVGDISRLPWDDCFFDIVLDRGALTQNNYEHIEAVLAEAWRVLKPGGRMMCFTLFGMRTPDRTLGIEVSRNTYDRFKEGRFSRVGLTSFFTVPDLRRLFHRFSEVEIHRHVEYNEADRILNETYSVKAVK